MSSHNSTPKIFIAYSRRDSQYLDELRSHLSPLERGGQIEVWYDGKIEPGRDWDSTLKDALYSADIIMLLVSSDSISSEYFYGKEVAISLERHHRNEVKIIPVILRSCAWNLTPLASLQALPKNGMPISNWINQDEAYSDIVQHIGKIIKTKNGAPTPRENYSEATFTSDIKPEAVFQNASQTNIFSGKKVYFGVGVLCLLLFFVWVVYFFNKESNQDFSTSHAKYSKYVTVGDSLYKISLFAEAISNYNSALIFNPKDHRATIGRENSIKDFAFKKQADHTSSITGKIQKEPKQEDKKQPQHSEIKKAPAEKCMYIDKDGDGYGDANSECKRIPANDVAKFPNYVENNRDCYDENANVHPGQAQFFVDPRGDGSNLQYDYNCDGIVELQYPSNGRCQGGCGEAVQGWDGAIPSPGANGQWLKDCDYKLGHGCVMQREGRKQGGR